MRKSIVAGNWKMFGSRSFVNELLSRLKNALTDQLDLEVAVFPPYVFLEQTQKLLVDTWLQWGGQNVYQAAEGAYTGEISPSMLRDFGCNYVIIGHSERRHLMGETDQVIFNKVKIAAKYGLKPILCVGETLEERESNNAFAVISQQLALILNDSEGLAAMQQGVIAYEPVWAIGTGLTATPDIAQEMHAYIRQEVEKSDKNLAQQLRILYGGSVKPGNAAALFVMPDIDGGLIGGASLNANEFLEIVASCNS